MEKPYSVSGVNGVKTVLYPFKNSSTVNIHLIINAGSWYEDKNNWGAFHFLEHLVHLGTEMFPTEKEIFQFKESHGLSSSAFASGGQIGFSISAPHYSFKEAIILLNQIVFHPTLPEKYFDKEISIITQEYNDKWDDLHNRISLSVSKQIYGNSHPYIRDGMGQPEYIETLSRKQIINLHQKYFTKENGVLAITGKINYKEAQKVTRSHLKPLSFKTKNSLILFPVPEKKQIVHYEPVENKHICISWPIPGYQKSPLVDQLGFGVANYILGGSDFSVLFKKLREDLGLVYSIYSTQYKLPKGGVFSIKTTANKKNYQKTIEEIRKATYGFVKDVVPQSEFKRAIAFMNARTIMSYDSPKDVVFGIANDLAKKRKIHLAKDYIEISNSLTRTSIKKLLLKYINPENELTAVMKNEISV